MASDMGLGARRFRALLRRDRQVSGLRRDRQVSGLRRDRRGSAAVEMALLLPLMTMLVCGTLQYGVLMFTYNSMLNAARNGARSLAVGSANEATVTTTTKANLPPWVAAGDWTITPQDTATTGTNQVTTSISVSSEKATIMPIIPMPDKLDVKVVMLKEA
jgi:Flp pilus assembly protein TadG